MSNSTIYPYGTNGELPSSIGLINDLVTGGADKALAAEQGKVLGTICVGSWSTIDVSEYQTESFSIDSSDKWSSGGLHKAIPLTSGKRYRVTLLTCTDTNSTEWWCVCGSTYSTTLSAGNSVPYSEYGKRWMSVSSASVVVDATAGNANIIIGLARAGSVVKATWKVEVYVDSGNEDTFLKKSSSMKKKNLIQSSDLSTKTYSFNGSGIWGSNTSYNHYEVPVVGGGTITVLCKTSTSTGGLMAIARKGGATPAAGETIGFASGITSARFISTGTLTTITLPDNASYILLDGYHSQFTATWEVNVDQATTLGAEVDGLLLRENIVNDLVTGGTDAPLSAEQGKILNEKVSGDIPYGLTEYSYTGAKIQISESHKVAVRKIATVGIGQGAARFGNYLFCFETNNTQCTIKSLPNLTTVATVSIDPGFVSDNHANTVNFGHEYYSSSDQFPLIYVSTGYRSDGYSGAIVYRIQHTEASEGISESWSLSIVQTLKFPGNYWTEFIVGDDDNCYVYYTGLYRIYRFAMPKLSAGETVIFDLSAALETYTFAAPADSDISGSSGQGCLYHSGKIYVPCGVPTRNQKCFLKVLDLATRLMVGVIDFTDMGITDEPEAAFIYQDHLCIAFRMSAYMFYFD